MRLALFVWSFSYGLFVMAYLARLTASLTARSSDRVNWWTLGHADDWLDVRTVKQLQWVLSTRGSCRGGYKTLVMMWVTLTKCPMQEAQARVRGILRTRLGNHGGMLKCFWMHLVVRSAYGPIATDKLCSWIKVDRAGSFWIWRLNWFFKFIFLKQNGYWFLLWFPVLDNFGFSKMKPFLESQLSGITPGFMFFIMNSGLFCIVKW